MVTGAWLVASCSAQRAGTVRQVMHLTSSQVQNIHTFTPPAVAFALVRRDAVAGYAAYTWCACLLLLPLDRM
jgi:hypothetical protein